MEVSEANNIVANSHAGDMTYWQQAAQVLINDLRRRVEHLEVCIEAVDAHYPWHVRAGVPRQAPTSKIAGNFGSGSEC